MINHFFNNATWWAEMPENFSGWGIVNDDNSKFIVVYFVGTRK